MALTSVGKIQNIDINYVEMRFEPFPWILVRPTIVGLALSFQDYFTLLYAMKT